MAVRTIRPNDPQQVEIVRVLTQLAVLVNELKADHNGAMTKLDADAGVTDTNYSATRAIAAPDADTLVAAW